MTNNEILEAALNSGLLKRCVDCQFFKAGITEYKDDFFQDLCLIILEYDNEKLNDAYKKHFNAWITRVIQNNIMSINSKFYSNYKRWDNAKAGDIKELGIDLIDE